MPSLDVPLIEVIASEVGGGAHCAEREPFRTSTTAFAGTGGAIVSSEITLGDRNDEEWKLTVAAAARDALTVKLLTVVAANEQSDPEACSRKSFASHRPTNAGGPSSFGRTRCQLLRSG